MSDAEAHSVAGEAIAKGVCLSAAFNGGALLIAPYSLIYSGGRRVLRAVVLEEDGERGPAKMSDLDMASLSEITLTRRTFRRDPRMEPGRVKPARLRDAADD